MGQVTFAINGRSYRIGCADGEEKRLAELARDVAARVDRLVMEFGQVGEARLLLMAALLASDELFDVRANLDVLVAEAAERLHAAAADNALDSARRDARRDGDREAVDGAPRSDAQATAAPTSTPLPSAKTADTAPGVANSEPAGGKKGVAASSGAAPTGVAPAASVPSAASAPTVAASATASAVAAARPDASVAKSVVAQAKPHRGQRIEMPGRARSA